MANGLTDRFGEVWQRRRLVYEIVIYVLVAGGVTLLASSLLEPQWSVLFFLDHLPGLVMETISWLSVRPKTAITIYGGVLTVGALGVFAVIERRAHLGLDRYQQMQEPMRLRFLITGGFIAGFLGARAIVVVGGLANTEAEAGFSLLRQIEILGYHIHHFFFGFVILVIVGWAALLRPNVSRRWLAFLYGLGIGVFVDEFGLLLTWGDYYARQSWFVAITFLSILVAAMTWMWGTADWDGSAEG